LDTPERVRWLRPSEVTDLFEAAGLFRVPRSTLGDWAKSGKLTYIRTLGGHRRYREPEVRSLVAALSKVAA
jgi:excisionase family DNA binding protein